MAFEVNDGLAGFPASVIEQHPAVEMKVEDGSLRIRSTRTAIRYLGDSRASSRMRTASWIPATCSNCEVTAITSSGRRDGVINVGGLKVHPEEVEAVINRHPQVQMSLVRTKKNPITGALVVADVVLKAAPQSADRDVRATRARHPAVLPRSAFLHKGSGCDQLRPCLACC